MRRSLVLLLCVLGACGGDSSLVFDPLANRFVETGVVVELDRSSYRAGDLITVTLINRTSRSYGYNLCGRRFERLIGDDWSAMPPELRLCTADLQGLPPGEFRTGQTDLPADFGPGTYRLIVAVRETTPGATASALVMSAPFTVQ